MIIFLHAFRSLAEAHSSLSMQFVAALMSSSQRARQMVQVQQSSMSTLYNVGWLALDRFPLPGVQPVTSIACTGACFAV